MKLKPTRLLVREAIHLVRELKNLDGLAQIDECLSDRGEYFPYAQTAISRWQDFFSEGLQFGGRVTHSLAVALHSRAWDLELEENSSAESDWTSAITYWRELTQVPEFWEGMKTRMYRCDENSDLAEVEELRKGLMEHLLELHVLFILDYADRNRLDRSKQHVRIFEHAEKVPPVLKKKLTQRVYEGMTSAVPEALAKGETQSAITLLDRFLGLFPRHFEALARVAEVAEKIAARLSARTQWDEIFKLYSRASEWFTEISQCEEYGKDPLAREHVENLLQELIGRCNERSELIMQEFDNDNGRISLYKREEAFESWGFAIQLAEKLGDPREKFRPGTAVGDILGGSLNSCACYRMDHTVSEMIASLEEEGGLAARAIQRCIRLARKELELAIFFLPNDATIKSNLEAVKETERDTA